MSVGLVVVSHSHAAATGIADIAREMGGDARIEAVGGDPEGGIGTAAPPIRDAIESVAADTDAVAVFVDIGSAVMNAELAIEMASPPDDVAVEIADAPILEGAFSAAVEAAGANATLESVLDAAAEAREYHKVE